MAILSIVKMGGDVTTSEDYKINRESEVFYINHNIHAKDNEVFIIAQKIIVKQKVTIKAKKVTFDAKEVECNGKIITKQFINLAEVSVVKGISPCERLEKHPQQDPKGSM